MFSSLKISLTTVAIVGLMVPTGAQAQDITSCSQIDALVQDENYGDAIWELDACRRGLETLWYNGLVAALSVPIAGLEPSGGTVEGAFGINALEIRHGDVSTTFTSGAGAAESPMSGPGALAALGSSFGVREAGVEEVRLGRRTTGRLEEQSDGSFSLMVTLDEGVLVQEGPDKDILQAVATETIEILRAYFSN